MKVITTYLMTSSNSVVVRLPQELLRMSGLGQKVTLEAKRGKVIISQPVNPRASWPEQIEAQLVTDVTGLDRLPWDGPSYEDWQKSQGVE